MKSAGTSHHILYIHANYSMRSAGTSHQNLVTIVIYNQRVAARPLAICIMRLAGCSIWKIVSVTLRPFPWSVPVYIIVNSMCLNHKLFCHFGWIGVGRNVPIQPKFSNLKLGKVSLVGLGSAATSQLNSGLVQVMARWGILMAGLGSAGTSQYKHFVNCYLYRVAGITRYVILI